MPDSSLNMPALACSFGAGSLNPALGGRKTTFRRAGGEGRGGWCHKFAREIAKERHFGEIKKIYIYIYK